MHAATVAGVDVPEEIAHPDGTLTLRGAGVRKRLFLKLYVAALYGGERFDLVYRPGEGTAPVRDGETLAAVPGLASKEALFGIWLSDDPVQTDLKAAMTDA